MDIKLESLIEKIKKDGIEEANKTASEIISKAEKEKEGILKEAKNQAKDIIVSAEDEAKMLKQNTENSLRQAARDLVLILRQQLTDLFGNVLRKKTKESLSVDFLSKLISKIVESWAKKQEFEVMVSEADKKKLESLLAASIRDQAKSKIEIKVDKGIDKGFKIGIKGEDVYYDFTDESILCALHQLLSPSISAMLDKK